MDGRRARIVLGVADDAGAHEIRRAFRARALVTHPDRGGDGGSFVELVAALDALDSVVAVRPAPVAVHLPVALPASRRRFDVYDSARRPAPRRAFADVLRAASARLS